MVFLEKYLVYQKPHLVQIDGAFLSTYGEIPPYHVYRLNIQRKNGLSRSHRKIPDL